jgi:nitroimidazol reductase NimA-like FMN-containing flavoprotein (pyridoxamine 5'-phosphate oxidase superfamily)
MSHRSAPRAVRGHLSWAWVTGQLRASRSIWLATARPGGGPHVMPLWFWWDEPADPPRLYFITARGTQKARNLAARPTAIAHLGDGDDVVIVSGPVAVVTQRSESDRVDAAYREKYVDPHTGARASVYDNPLDDVYRLDVERVVAWMYGVVGTWTEWRFKPAAPAGQPGAGLA